MFLLILLLALSPAVFWFFIYNREEKFDPEPKSIVIKLFFLGVATALIASFVEFLIITLFPAGIEETLNILLSGEIAGGTPGVLFGVLAAVFLFAVVEEILKISVLRFFYKNPNFNQMVDGAIFAISAALGFAATENVAYFAGAFFSAGVGGLIITFIFRFFASTLLHTITSGIAGYFLAQAKFTGDKSRFFLGLILAIFIHFIFNLLLFSGFFGIIFNIFMLITLFIFLIRRLETRQAQTIWKLVGWRDRKGD